MSQQNLVAWARSYRTAYAALPPGTIVGAADCEPALSDALDTSYIYVPSGGGSAYTVRPPLSVIGRLCSIGLYVRATNTSSEIPSARVFGFATDDAEAAPIELAAVTIPNSSSPVDYVAQAYQGADPSGTTNDAANLAWVAYSNSQAAHFLKVEVRAYYLTAVQVTSLSAPAGTVTTTQKPTLTAALALAVEDWQVPSGASPFLCGGDVQYQVFRAADAPGASPPAGVAPLWSGSVRYSETTVGARTPSVSAVCGSYLTNGTYVAFARASRDLKAGTGLYFSAWKKSAVWTQNVASPATPTLALARDDAGQRIGFTVTEAATTGYDSATAIVEAQRLVDGVWRIVRDVSGKALTVGSAQAAGYDYEAERGATNTYRVRVTMWHTADAVQRASAWIQQTVAGPSVSGWNLKTVENIAASWLGARVLTGPAEATMRAVTILEVLDRGLPVAVGGVSAGMSGTYDLSAASAADVAILRALRDYSGLVLVESAFGEAKHVRITKLTWTFQGTAAAPRRRATIEYAEVDSGLATVAG